MPSLPVYLYVPVAPVNPAERKANKEYPVWLRALGEIQPPRTGDVIDLHEDAPQDVEVEEVQYVLGTPTRMAQIQVWTTPLAPMPAGQLRNLGLNLSETVKFWF